MTLAAAPRWRRKSTAGRKKSLLTVDADDDLLAAAVEAFAPDILQLHGAETAGASRGFRAKFGRPVMKAIGLEPTPISTASRPMKQSPTMLLFDARAGECAALPGGNGRAFDWTLLAGRRFAKPWLLGGGLTAENVGQAMPRPALGALTSRRVSKARAASKILAKSAVSSPRARAAEKLGSLAESGYEQETVRCEDLFATARSSNASLGLLRQARDDDRERDELKLENPNSFRTGPDERGHFGIFGGRFVAETLMPLILDLERALRGGEARSRRSRPNSTACSPIMSGAPSPLYFAERLTDHLRAAARQDLFQARGAEPHRRAQDQQCARPDSARAAHGQDAHHRRDRRRPAWRRHRHRLRALRPRMHRLYGRGRCRAAEAECLPHEHARRQGRAGASPARSTLKDAMNEALRDWVTNVADTFYCIGTAAGPHPYPAMVRDFQCVIGEETRAADAGRRKAGCRIRSSPASAAARTPSACFILSSMSRQIEIYGVEAAGYGLDKASMRPRSPAGGRASCTAIAPIF